MSLLTKGSESLNLDIEKPSSAANDFGTELFINVVIRFKLNDVWNEYRPVGARFTTKLKNELPKLFEALTTREKPLEILEHDFQVVKGDEIKKEEFKQTLENLDDNLKKMMTALTPEQEQEYTSYLKVVGNLYAVSQSGNKRRINVFNPSMDVKVGTEAKELDRQKLLLAAVLSGSEVKVNLESIKVNSESEPEVEEDY